MAVLMFCWASFVLVQQGCRTTENQRSGNQWSGVLSGRVLGPDRCPVPGAKISLLPGDGRPMTAPVSSDTRGGFLLMLRIGFYTVHINAAGFEELWETIVTRDGNTKTVRDFILQLRLPQRGRIDGSMRRHSAAGIRMCDRDRGLTQMRGGGMGKPLEKRAEGPKPREDGSSEPDLKELAQDLAKMSTELSNLIEAQCPVRLRLPASPSGRPIRAA